VNQSLRVLLACGSPQIGHVTRECLQLRALATLILHGAPESVISAAVRAIQPVSARGWRTFLLTERCAIWLHSELQARNLLAPLDQTVRAAILHRRDHELRRVLTARAQLFEMARLIERADQPVIVLKGAVAALRDSPIVDLSDVDVLPSDGRAQSLANRLDHAGYAPRQDVEPDPAHLLPRQGEGLLYMEVHTSLADVPADMVAAMRLRAQPFSALPMLSRLAPADHLWHLLVHVGLSHMERRGSIRDQLLMRLAAAECNDDELSRVRQCAHEHPAAAILKKVLAAALTCVDPDPFMRMSAARYAAAAAIFSQGPPPPAWLWQPLKNFTLELATDRRAFRTRIGQIATPAPVVSKQLAGDGSAAFGLLVVLRIVRLLFITPLAGVLALRSQIAARYFHRALTPS
jgi:hypothetical protein